MYNRGNLVDYGWILDATKTANVWIPVCCERVMRFNIFVQKTGTPYGSLVCTVCNKSVSFELEHQVDLNQYGDGARRSVFWDPETTKRRASKSRLWCRSERPNDLTGPSLCKGRARQ